jgi:predicted outer membrane repeat protein
MQVLASLFSPWIRGTLALFVIGASVAQAQEVSVGPAADPECDYQSVQDAIDDWVASPETGHLTVYLDNTQVYGGQALTISTPSARTSIALRGDRAGCSGFVFGGRAELDGSGGAAAPVIDILGDAAGEVRRFEVQLNNLQISGGDHVAGNGGGVRARGNVVVYVFETTVRDNVAQNGGGLAFEATADGAPHLVMVGNQRPAEIAGNTAGDGGGIYCRDATLYCDHYCLIAGNTASGNGGAIAQDNCVTSLYVPDGSEPSDPDVGLRDNRASGDGGAVWASDGVFWVGSGFSLHSSPVRGNRADGHGGAIYLANEAEMMAGNTRFDDNHAGGNGGAIAADGARVAHLNAATSVGGGCARSLDDCARFRGNSAAPDS